MAHYVIRFTLFLLSLIFAINLGVVSQDLNVDSLRPPVLMTPEDPIISPNGNFVSFLVISNNNSERKQLIVRSIVDDRQIEFENCKVGSIIFSDDSRFMLFLDHSNRLNVLKLSDYSAKSIDSVAQFTYFRNSMINWITYRTLGQKNNIYISKISLHNPLLVGSGSNYFANNDQKSLFFCFNNLGSSSIVQIRFKDFSRKVIWTGRSVSSFIISSSGKSLAFVGATNDTKPNRANIFLISINNSSIWLLPDSDTSIYGSNYKIVRVNGFSYDEKSLLVTFSSVSFDALQNVKSRLSDVWSYSDVLIQSDKSSNKGAFLQGIAFIKISDGTCVFKQKPNEVIFNDKSRHYLLLGSFEDRLENDDFSSNKRSVIYSCVNLSTGIKYVFGRSDTIGSPSLSPIADFVVFRNKLDHQVYSYSLNTYSLRNISNSFVNIDSCFEEVYSSYRYFELLGWTADGLSVLFKSYHDLWRLSIKGLHPPINISNNFGLVNNIVFRPLALYNRIYPTNKPIYISAFDKDTKRNGFYRLNISNSQNPEMLAMDDCVFVIPDNQYVPSSARFEPVKAKISDVFLVKKMATSLSPNFYITRTFHDFQQISFITPDTSYPLMGRKLVQIRTRPLQYGVLYTPYKFDTLQRYPVIFHYYEKLSDRLNVFTPIEYSNGDINIPWFVNNGYLVFDVDMSYVPYQIGESISSSLSSAINGVSKFSFVDTSKMALQGFSFGGYETNYAITQTNRFSAAVAAAGMTNLTSFAYSINKEAGFWTNIGGRFWPRPSISKNHEYFVKYSPIFSVNKVRTPLLLMNNKMDDAVDFTQALEFYLALRQQQSKVWLLQYDDGQHGVFGESSEDFSIKMLQFYNHFLKGATMPSWMVSSSRYGNL
jgi:dipeptidyl aminopeptidase/acylaminoacyl peptidase